jgi:hypothetical protein
MYKSSSELTMYGGSDDHSPTAFSAFWLIVYILLKYPIKYFILFYLFFIILSLLKQVYDYWCKAAMYILKFFKIILEPGEFDLIIFKLPDIFNIFMGFLDLFIGLIYLCIGMLFFIGCGLVSIPFNLIFSM